MISKSAIAQTNANGKATLDANPMKAERSETAKPDAMPSDEDSIKEQSQGVSFSWETDFNSRYVFRGLALSDGAVVQPSVYASQGGYTLGLWANFNASRGGAQARRFNELDVTLTKTIERGRTTIEPAALLYLYPSDISPTTGEITLLVSRSYKNFSVFSSHAVDVLEYSGAYYGEIGVSHEREFSPRLSGEAKVSLGMGNSKFNEVNIGPRKWALNTFGLDLSLSRTINERMYIRPHLSFTRILDRELRDSVADGTICNLGIALGGEF